MTKQPLFFTYYNSGQFDADVEEWHTFGRPMGYDTKTEITGHSFRAMAGTILAEELYTQPSVIKHQLANKAPDALGANDNRTNLLKDRRVMMQEWADYLDRLKAGPNMLPFANSMRQIQEISLGKTDELRIG